MTSRTASLDNNLISSDLTASGSSLKKTSQSEIKFQQVLTKTQENSSKDSNRKPLSNSNSEDEKNNEIRNNNRNNHNQQAGKAKQASHSPVNASGDKQNKITNEKGLEQSSDIKSEEVIEDIQNEKLEDDSELLSAILMAHNNDKLAPDDLAVSENLSIRLDNPINTAEEVIDYTIPIGYAESTIINNGNTETSNAVRVSKNANGIILPAVSSDAEIAIIQVMPTILEDAKSKNLSQGEILPELDTQSKILNANEAVQVKASANNEGVDEEDTIPAPLSINIANVQSLPQEDITANESAFNLVSKLPNIKNFDAATVRDTHDTTLAETGAEENIGTFISAQNLQGQNKTSKGNAVLEEIQNTSNLANIDELLSADQEIFDRSGSNEFDNLFSKMDSFVTINDGKLVVDFKEIANLPEENVPHRADQITMAVRTAVGRGQSEISLRMYPEDLGAVDVKVEFSEVGKVQSIKFFATKESTLELLQKDYSILERSLKEVINAEDASLSFNLKDGRGEGSEYQPQEDFGLNGFIESSERIVTTNYQATLQITQDDQVDITV